MPAHFKTTGVHESTHYCGSATSQFLIKMQQRQARLIQHAALGKVTSTRFGGKLRLGWWRKFDAGRTLTLPLNGSHEHPNQPLGDSQLLKPSDAPTALELAEHYDHIARTNNLTTTRELARYLNQPYRTIKSITRLLKLCSMAKRLLRDASKEPALRRQLTRWALEGLVVGASPRTQLMNIRKLLSSMRATDID